MRPWSVRASRVSAHTTVKYTLYSVFALPLRDLFLLSSGESAKIFRKSQNVINLYLKKKKQQTVKSF